MRQRTRKYKSPQAMLGAAIRRELKEIGIKAKVRSLKDAIVVSTPKYEQSFSPEEGEEIVRIGKFFELTGVRGTELSVYGKRKKRIEMQI